MGEPLSSPAESSHRDARLAGLTSWHADWSGVRVVVLGLGATGFAVVDTLVELGAEVLVVAGEATDERRELAALIGAEVRIADGEPAAAALLGAEPDVVVVSPGYRPDHAALRAAIGGGIPVWSDVALAWRTRDKVAAAEWLLVAGGDDVAATAELAAAMLIAAGVRAAPAGTSGVPALDAIRDPGGFDVLVVGVSSRQLHWTPAGALAPLASLCLTAGEDGAGGSADVADLRRDLGRVYANTRVACVYPLAEPAARELVEDAEVQEGCRAIGIGLGIPGPSDLGIVEDILVDRAFLEERRDSALELATLDDLSGAGLGTPAAAARVLAAAALARAAGVPQRAVLDGIRLLSAR